MSDEYKMVLAEFTVALPLKTHHFECEGHTLTTYQIFELFLCHLNFQRTHYVTYSSIKQIFIECYHVPHTVLALRIQQRTKVTKIPVLLELTLQQREINERSNRNMKQEKSHIRM